MEPEAKVGRFRNGPTSGICDNRIVGDKDHSRRLQRVLGRAMEGHPAEVTVRPSRYSGLTLIDGRNRGGIRTEIVESQKLLLDFVLHPISFSESRYPASGGAVQANGLTFVRLRSS